MAGYTKDEWILVCDDVVGDRPVGDDGVRFWSIMTKPYRGNVAHIHAALNIQGITLAERDANARLIGQARASYEALVALWNYTQVLEERLTTITQQAASGKVDLDLVNADDVRDIDGSHREEVEQVIRRVNGIPDPVPAPEAVESDPVEWGPIP